jgi:hypothetical protein
MKAARFICASAIGAVGFFGIVQSAGAVISTGPGGQGVLIGNSSLIGEVDFADTFTGSDALGIPNRPYQAAVQPAPAYIVENTFGGPLQRNFRSQTTAEGVAEFSFAADGPGTPGLVNGNPSYPGSSGAGSDTGFTQTGRGVDYGLNYGLRTDYVVQVDAVQVGDRIDITSGPIPGTIFTGGNSVSVFFRGNGSGNASLFNGTTDTPIHTDPNYSSFTTGITGRGQWHNYAVRFDQDGHQIEIFVDEVSRGVIDLDLFAGGIYANFSNAAVGAGAGMAAGENRTWTDNFQVGAVVPEPGMGMLVCIGAAALLSRRGGKR